MLEINNSKMKIVEGMMRNIFNSNPKLCEVSKCSKPEMLIQNNI